MKKHKLDFTKTKKLLCFKRSHKESDKITCWLEIILEYHTSDMILVSHREYIIVLLNNKMQEDQFKNCQTICTYIPPQKIYKWPLSTQKMCNIISH